MRESERKEGEEEKEEKEVGMEEQKVPG